MGFLKGVFAGAGGVVGAVITAATVCAIRDIRKEEKESWLRMKEYEKQEDADSVAHKQAESDFDNHVSREIEKMVQKKEKSFKT